MTGQTGQALLDYVTGARGTIFNEGQADRNGDGGDDI